MKNKKTKIFFLGPNGSNCQIALDRFQDSILPEAEAIEISTITKILDLTDKNEDCFAVVPIENSIEGVVRETIDNLLNSKKTVKILSETVIKIEHQLLAKGNKKDIKKIFSHPQALSQCQKYISDNFDKSIELISTSSTSNAASFVSKSDNSCACIANKFCAELYNLNILDNNINDNKNNFTRFILLGHKGLGLGCNRTSLAFSTKNEPGALLKILKIFEKYNLNLIYLESRPSKIKLGEYVFFADVDKGTHAMQEALDEISKKSDLLRIFGSYKVI